MQFIQLRIWILFVYEAAVEQELEGHPAGELEAVGNVAIVGISYQNSLLTKDRNDNELLVSKSLGDAGQDLIDRSNRISQRYRRLFLFIIELLHNEKPAAKATGPSWRCHPDSDRG